MPFVYSVRGTHSNPKDLNKSSNSSQFEVTGGDKIFTAGGYVIHMFTTVGDAKLTVKPRNNNYSNTVDYLTIV